MLNTIQKVLNTFVPDSNPEEKTRKFKDTLNDSPEPSQLTTNQDTPQRVTRSTLPGQKTPLGEATNQDVRRSPRLKGKASPQKSSRKRTLEPSPSTSAKRHSGMGVIESSESKEIPMCMVNTATGLYLLNFRQLYTWPYVYRLRLLRHPCFVDEKIRYQILNSESCAFKSFFPIKSL